MRGHAPNTEVRRFFDPEEPFATCAELQREQRAVDRRLIDVCAALAADRLEMPVPVQRRTGIETESATRLLAHLFQHQIHHRGQVHAMLAGTKVPPPQLDEFFSAGEAELRIDDFRELGWTEEMIWPCAAH